jgi:hypothetical protein
MQEERKADREADKEKMDAMQEDMKAGKEKNVQILARMEAQREEREAERKAYLENVKRMTEEMLAKVDANLAKSNTHNGMMQSVGAYQEVTKEEAAVMPVGEPRKRRRNRNLATERRQKPKDTTRGYCGFRNRVTIADRKVSPRATVARRRRNIFAQE